MVEVLGWNDPTAGDGVSLVAVTGFLMHVTEFHHARVDFYDHVHDARNRCLAVGFGTMYPRFETENAAQIPTSFGGCCL